MKYFTPVGLRVPLDLVERVDKKVEEKVFSSRTEGFLYYLQIGLHADSFKFSIKDPDFLKEIDALKEGNQLFEWAETLKDNEREAIAAALQLVKDQKFVQRKFV